MATAEEERLLNEEKRKGTEYSQKNAFFEEQSAQNASHRVSFARSLTEELKDQLGIKSKLHESERIILDLSRKVTANLSLNNVELGNAYKIRQQIVKDETLLNKIQLERKILQNSLGEEGIAIAQNLISLQKEALRADAQSEKLNREKLNLQSELNKLKEQAKEEVSLIGVESGTQQTIKKITNHIKELDSEISKLNQKELAFASEREKAYEKHKISKIELERLQVLGLMESNLRTSIGLRREEESIQERINSKMGVTGSIMTGIGGIMERLGMRSGMFNDAMHDAKEAMHEMAEETVRGHDRIREIHEQIKEVNRELGKGYEISKEDGQDLKEKLKTLENQKRALEENVRNYSKIQIGLKGAQIGAKAFGKALLDPLTIAYKIFDAFLEVNRAAVDYRRLTGLNVVETAGLNDRLLTSAEYLQTAAELTQQVGLAATLIFTPDELAAIGEAKNLLGLSAEQAGKLGIQARLIGKNVDNFKASIYEGVKASNELYDSVVPPGLAFKDILSTSEDITLSLGSNPERLGRATVAARKFGLTLEKVDQIANSLVDFESSIESELEAQLLLGKRINLNKAREFALMNDMEGVASELARNGATAAEFANLGRIKQEGLAKALGMSRQELAKSIIAQDIQNKLTERQKSLIRGVSVEQSEQISIQERIQKSLAKVTEAFAPLLESLVPALVGAISILQTISQLIAYLVQPLSRVLSYVGKIGEVFKIIKEELTSILGLTGKVRTEGEKLPTGQWIASISVVTALLIRKATLIKSIGKGIFKFIVSPFQLAGKVIKSTGNLLKKAFSFKSVGKQATEAAGKVAGSAIPGKGVTEKAAESVEKARKASTSKTAGKGIKTFLVNLSTGLKAMGSGKVLLGAFNLIPTSVGLIAMIPGIAGAKLVEKINGPKIKKGLLGLAAGLESMKGTLKGSIALITASAGLIAMIPGTVGAKLLEKFNGTLVGKNLKMLAVGLQSMSKTFTGSAALIAAGAAFTLMIPGAAGMTLFGLAAPLAASGLNILGPALVTFGSTAGTVGWLGVAVILALSAAAIGLGFALKLATPAIQALGDVVLKVFSGISSLVSSTMKSFSDFIEILSLDKLKGIYLLGPALLSVSTGLIAFTAAATGAAVAGIFVGKITKRLQNISDLSQPLESVANSMTLIKSTILNIGIGFKDSINLIKESIKEGTSIILDFSKVVITSLQSVPVVSYRLLVFSVITTGVSKVQEELGKLKERSIEILANVKLYGLDKIKEDLRFLQENLQIPFKASVTGLDKIKESLKFLEENFKIKIQTSIIGLDKIKESLKFLEENFKIKIKVSSLGLGEIKENIQKLSSEIITKVKVDLSGLEALKESFNYTVGLSTVSVDLALIKVKELEHYLSNLKGTVHINFSSESLDRAATILLSIPDESYKILKFIVYSDSLQNLREEVLKVKESLTGLEVSLNLIGIDLIKDKVATLVQTVQSELKGIELPNLSSLERTFISSIEISTSSVDLALSKLKSLKSYIEATDFSADVQIDYPKVEPIIKQQSILEPIKSFFLPREQTKETTRESENKLNEKLLQKIDQLISVVREGGNVYLDGDKVGSSLVLGSVKSS